MDAISIAPAYREPGTLQAISAGVVGFFEVIITASMCLDLIDSGRTRITPVVTSTAVSAALWEPAS